MSAATDLNNSGRRNFLKSGLALTGGLLLEISAGGMIAVASQEAQAAGQAEFIPNAWVRIATDGQIQLVVHKFDSGTGIKNALGLMLAEELDADWSRVTVIQPENPLAKAYIHPIWGMHATGGSTSVPLEWPTLRKAGATARAMLVAAAAKRWQVDPASCRTENSAVMHGPTQRKLGYGELAQDANRELPPEKVALKAPEQFRLIGKEHKSYRVEEKVSGKAKYAIDIKLPGMLTAIVVHSPVVHGKVKSFNAAEVKALPGVRDVFAMDIPDVIVHFKQNMPAARPDNGASQAGVAIVADNFWAAQKARKVLKVEWDDGKFASFNSADAIKSLAQHGDDEGLKSNTKGNAKAAFIEAKKVVEAEYAMPYKTHAQMEPTSLIAWVKPDAVEYWGGIQVPSRCAQAAETIAGVSRDKVKLHITEAGGSFGAREGLHFTLEATYIAKRVGQPVKLLYSREDDIRGLYYHCASVHKMRVALDANNAITGFSMRAVVPSIKEPDDPGFLAKFPVDPSCTEGMRKDFYYDFEHMDIAWVRHESGFPTWWWRGVSYVPNIFAIESIVDETAVAVAKDPYLFRRDLLKNKPAHLAVLDKAAELAQWQSRTKAPTKDRALGMATYQGYDSYIAIIADVTANKDGVRVHKITCVVDCGLAIDPSSVRQQIAGGIYWGVSTALHDEIHIENGRVRESNYHDYPVVRMSDAPEIDIVLMPAGNRGPCGVGELSNPPVVPAIGNAIFAATGNRLRRTPFALA